MEEENPGNTFSPPPPQEELSVKRKRGRPRKDQSGKREKKSRTVEPTEASNGGVGQEVTGVVNAAFDAGYLITVRIGSTGTVYSGVVFKPGNYIPLSSKIDVAPNVQLIARNGQRPKQRYNDQYSDMDDHAIPGNGDESMVPVTVVDSNQDMRNGGDLPIGANPDSVVAGGKSEEMDDSSDTLSAEPLQIVHSDSISSRSSNMGRMSELLQVLQRENEEGDDDDDNEKK